ncbi:MAG: energy transducer TonB [Candidatus Acidiferrales bacterium]
MIFQNQYSTDPVFRFKPQGAVAAPVQRLPFPARSSKIPTFTVRRESAYSGWWGSLRVLLGTARASASAATSGVFRNVMLARRYFRGAPLSLSFVLHCAVIFLLIFVPRVIPIDAPELESVPNRIETIYYLPDRHSVKPEVHPAPAHEPRVKEPAPSHAALPAVKLTHPENAQKAVQSTSAPVLRITAQASLPDLILAKPLDAPKVPFQYNPNVAKPMRQARNVAAGPAPSLTPSGTTGSGMIVLSASTTQPILPLAVGPTLTSHRGGGGGGGDLVAEAPSIGEGSASAGPGTVLMVVGAPAGLPGRIGAPSGNGSGGTSVSSSSGGGVPNGTVSVTYGGGDPGSGAGGDGLLKSDAVMNMVYAVPSSLNIRKNALIVSAGPIGGGGLGVYGALHCGKVDTIFLPMPGANWTMEYCPQGASAPQPTTESASAVVHLSQGIVPPQAESKFDFQRLPIPPSKAHKLIILKGSLRGDGTVGDLSVYQSILPLMDEAARAALSRWKFKPAMREGAPIPVQILVGIPVDEVSSRNTP